MIAVRRVIPGIVFVIAVGWSTAPAAAEGWSVDKLAMAATITEESVGGDSSADIALAVDATLSRPLGRGRFEFTLDSDYDKSFGDDDEFDRLKTWFRYLLSADDDREWVPLVVISTEGDHSLNSLQTLAAFGWRRNLGGGFLEITGGASKDVKTAQEWTGDVGVLFSFEKNWRRLTWNVRPEASYGVLGETRLRGDRLLYTLSTGLNYEVGEHLGIAWRIQFNNMQGDSRRYQLLGISYSR